jgi:hypothetical protein
LFYRAQPEKCDILVKAATNSCRKWAVIVSEGGTLSFDGSWSQRRSLLHYLGTFIETHLRKIIDFEVVKKLTMKAYRNFCGTSQAMEVEALSIMGKRWCNIAEIEAFVHNKDSHSMWIVQKELNSMLIEKFDKNHIVKTFNKRFEKLCKVPVQPNPDKLMSPRTRQLEESTTSTKPRRRNVLAGLPDHLLRWFYCGINQDATCEERQKRGWKPMIIMSNLVLAVTKGPWEMTWRAKHN